MSKPAAKPAARKSKRARSASLDDSDASMDLSLDTTLPSPLRDLTRSNVKRKGIATALLSLLPDGATKQSTAAKKLVSAFPLVVAELEARSKSLARANEKEGTRLPISFRFNDADGESVINMPEECFVNVLKFLKGREVVDSSLVSKVWLSASRMPALWERLDKSMGLTNNSKKLNMTSLIKLLQRPQFENLKFLQLPYKVKLGKGSIKQIAKAFPELEGFDVTNLHVHDGDLMEIVTQFPSLSSLRTEMWNATSFGIASIAQAMGDQLLDLRIEGDTITKHYLADNALRAIAASCPNLLVFTYMLSSYYYDASMDSLSGGALKTMIEGCRRLEVLRLLGVLSIKRADVASILELLDGANEGDFALRDIDLYGYPFYVEPSPLRIEDSERPRSRFYAVGRNMYDRFAS